MSKNQPEPITLACRYCPIFECKDKSSHDRPQACCCERFVNWCAKEEKEHERRLALARKNVMEAEQKRDACFDNLVDNTKRWYEQVMYGNASNLGKYLADKLECEAAWLRAQDELDDARQIQDSIYKEGKV